MSFENAQRFVSKMKEDLDFRIKVQSFIDIGSLQAYLQSQDYSFNRHDLVRAMAAFMGKLDKMMQQMNEEHSMR